MKVLFVWSLSFSFVVTSACLQCLFFMFLVLVKLLNEFGHLLILIVKDLILLLLRVITFVVLVVVQFYDILLVVLNELFQLVNPFVKLFDLVVVLFDPFE